MEFGMPEILRRAAVSWLERNCSSSLVVEDLQPCFGGCRIDAAALKGDGITAVLITTPGAIEELRSRVDVTKNVAEKVYVVAAIEDLAFMVEHVPAEAGVLVYDQAAGTMTAQIAARRNLVDPRSLAKLLTLHELRALTKVDAMDYLDLCRELLASRSLAEVTEQACATVRRRYEPRSFAPEQAKEPRKKRAGYLGMAAACALALVGSVAVGGDAFAQTISGKASVVDGDTIKIDGQRIRLWGIDALERDQRCEKAGESYNCGGRALGELAAQVGFSQVDCQVVDKDAYGRSVARCSVGGKDLAAYMVRSGWALDYSEYSKGAYKAAEVEARIKRRGAFAGTFTPPADYRKTARAEAMLAGPTRAPTSTCRIKGNVSAKGSRIFHVPGQADYDKTRVNEAHGDQWFCTPAEARANGFRPAAR